MFIFSGGGTVYHDLGNMNCTFFTRKSGYDRRRNLDIVCKAIQSMSQAINVRINDRDDIVVNSGSNKENDKKVDLLFDVFIFYKQEFDKSNKCKSDAI